MSNSEQIFIYNAQFNEDIPTGVLGEPYILPGNTNGHYDNYIIKYDRKGQVKWFSKIEGNDNDQKLINFFVKDGNVFVKMTYHSQIHYHIRFKCNRRLK